MKENITSIPIGDCKIEAINIYNILNEASSQTPIKHNHSFYEMHIIKRGVSRLIIEDELYETKEKQLIIIPKESYHYAPSCDESLICTAFNFDITNENDTGLSKKQEYAYFMNAFNVNFPIILPLDEPLERIYYEIEKLQYDYDIYSVNKLHIKIAEFFLEIANIVNKKFKKESDEFKRSKYGEEAIRKQVIDNMFVLRIDAKLEDYAKEVYLSPRQFERFVFKAYGKTFKEVINQKRMIRCMQMIKEGKYSLSKIATTLGYSSYGGFLSAYKKFFGTNPTENITKKENEE